MKLAAPEATRRRDTSHYAVSRSLVVNAPIQGTLLFPFTAYPALVILMFLRVITRAAKNAEIASVVQCQVSNSSPSVDVVKLNVMPAAEIRTARVASLVQEGGDQRDEQFPVELLALATLASLDIGAEHLMPAKVCESRVTKITSQCSGPPLNSGASSHDWMTILAVYALGLLAQLAQPKRNITRCSLSDSELLDWNPVAMTGTEQLPVADLAPWPCHDFIFAERCDTALERT